MNNPYVNCDNATKMNLHEGWLEHKSINETKWKRFWFLLQGNTLYFFNSQNTSNDSPCNMLCIEGHVRLSKRVEGSEKNGYKFELNINRRVYKFKASKFSEREQWRAYLEGVATGQVSDNIDLPSDSLNQIRLAVKQLQLLEGDSVSMIQQDVSEFPRTRPFGSFHSDADSGCIADDYVEPANSHLMGYAFGNDPYKLDVPSWFIQNCSRDMAEEILTRGMQHGNTLMRKGPTNTSNLVISKKMENTRDGFTHYRVVNQPDGYKLEVENPHQPMKTLTEVMNFFVQTSGPLTTKPLTCNNLHKFGTAQDHDYNPVILPYSSQASQHGESASGGYVNTSARSDKSQQQGLQLGESASGCYINTPHKGPQQGIQLGESASGCYVNTQSVLQKAQAWTKARSPSVPDLGIANHNVRNLRRQSSGFLSISDEDPSPSRCPMARPAPSALDIPPPTPPNHPPPLTASSLDKPPPPPPNHPPPLKKAPSLDNPPAPPPNRTPPCKQTLLDFPPPPLTQAPSPADRFPPSPPSNPPPPLPLNSKNKSKLQLSPSNDTPPPPPPLNNRPPLNKALSKSQLLPTESAASNVASRNNVKGTPPVAPKPPINTDNESQNGKQIGKLQADEFKKRLEMMFGGDKSKTLPVLRPTSRPILPSHLPSEASVETVSNNIPNTNEEMYDCLDTYQNASAIRLNMNVK